MDEKLEFKINQFEGPLDLLLHLIDKNKFNIFDIPIVEITEQYLDYLNRMQEENLDVMSEFLVMAATLISIKAKMYCHARRRKRKKRRIRVPSLCVVCWNTRCTNTHRSS